MGAKQVRSAAERLTAAVKTYDVRGLVDVDLTDEIIEAVGAAFVDEIDAEGTEVVVGHDMRDSSPRFAAAFSAGVRARGGNVVAIGLCSTDESYFASGSMDAAAAMFTASHNPSVYNGIKLSRPGAQSLSMDTGLGAIRDRAIRYLESGIPTVDAPGTERSADVLSDYARALRAVVPLEQIRPLRIVVDAGNGMGGMTVPAVLGEAAGLAALPVEIIPLYFELDGTFPNHEANPLDPANLTDLTRAVMEHGADAGLAFDGDADRCFVVDENGDAVSPSAVTAIVAVREIARERESDPAARPLVLHNLITSRFVPEIIESRGAEPVRTRVGHSLIKAQMRDTGAIFGGEHSAHYYFRDFWGADNGMLAAMHVLAELGSQPLPLSEFSAEFSPYRQSGEINSTVDDVPLAYARIVEAFQGRAQFDEMDGLTATGITPEGEPFWWFNVRPSNTEPLLRLNVEGEDAATMEAVRDEVLSLIRA
ncbi:phosphomannomutase/phosphoglucomutase [Paramicrobacterium agarici]|uniref:Phosphomannomutase n=1 Tax=Paramicrobacterium agarici TaxID=630514 RepID=A0A2A9DW67_9MICO|nr:phosphomannomutase/phosphoglucomutase [Microbacterium agarici]PFG30843.1 phosphomannomutase [Microbacterium agarici]